MTVYQLVDLMRKESPVTLKEYQGNKEVIGIAYNLSFLRAMGEWHVQILVANKVYNCILKEE